MKTLKFSLTGGGVSIVIALLAACSSTATEAPAPYPSGGPKDANGTFHDGTTVVDGDLADLANVLPDSVVFPESAFPKLSDRKEGDILIGQAQKEGTAGKNPDGFLRRVTRVRKTPAGTVVDTVPATLPEAVDKLDVHAALPGKGSTTKLLDYSGTKLFDFKATARAPDGTIVPYTAYARVEKGTLGFTPDFTLDADMTFLNVHSFKVSATGNLDAKLLIAAGVTIDKSVDPKAAAKIAGQVIKKTFSKNIADYDVNLGTIGLAGITIPLRARYRASLSCDFAFTAPVEAKVGGNATGSVTAGFSYADGKLTPAFDKSAALTRTAPTFTKPGIMEAYCSVSPTFELKMFGVATGQLTVNARAGMGASQTCTDKDATGITNALVTGDVEAGVAAKVLANVDVFGLYKWKKECTLFDVSEIESYVATYPYPGSPSATCVDSGSFPLPVAATANPDGCFDETDEPTAQPKAPIPGKCIHDVCTIGDKLGQACNDCTMKICAADSYCCDTFWGLSCFERVSQYCGRTCE